MKIFWLAALTLNALLVSGGTLLMRYGGKNIAGSGISALLQTGRLWLLGMVLCWLGGLVFAVILTRQTIVTAYGIYVPLTYILTVAGACCLMGEQLSGLRLAGLGLTLSGLVCLLLEGRI